ncbi:uncharacterized protein B0T15DRAFT_251659 [Chaetomium strumarium]|uniref:Uncharacterized protein n=1 Tax=Chaetomium strumarium TaxID=1170767 RepID=A0AAJ0GRC4_9PEZI|nr:hypothetical protein B0T15DRAFT_251659 [Chaetomium strumarium]
MTMTDEELDRDWQPNGRRPQSTIAQMFSQELMDIFRIENSVTDLDEQVDKRKQQIDAQTSELEALEARIREMERRLKMQTNPDNPGGSGAQSGTPGGQSQAPPEKGYSAADLSRAWEQRDHLQQQIKNASRPGTAQQNQPAVRGGLPPTPAGSEGEFESPVSHPSQLVLRPRRARAQPDPGAAVPSSSPLKEGGDSDSIKAMSESASCADYVIVPKPDGDRERGA